MYDTTSALCVLPPVIGRKVTWGKVLATEDPQTGERRIRQVLTTPRGLQATLMDGATLLVSRSLPKALYGTNVREIDQAELPAALAIVDAEIASELAPDLPPFASWSPVRVDYCQNMPLGSEAGVRTAITRLRDVSLPHKGRPVAGDSGTSIAWPRGAIRPKVYGKFVESGEELADGMLRYEVGVLRRGTFLKLLDRLPCSPISLSEVLQPSVRDVVLAKYSDLFGRSALSKQEMGDWQFCQELLRMFGGMRTAKLIGFCLIWVMAGSPTMKAVTAGKGVPGFSRATVYRYFAEVRDFRMKMIAKGYTWDGAGDALESDEKLIGYVASIRTRLPEEPAA